MKGMPASTPQELNRQTCRHAMTAMEGIHTGVVLGYVPIRGEIDPISHLFAVVKNGMTAAVPRCIQKDGVPQLQVLPEDAFISTPTSPDVITPSPKWNTAIFEEDAWGMAVPRARIPIRTSNLQVVLVPGLAFDLHGRRLGRGAGVYDRLLASLPSTVLRIGLVHDERLIDELPAEEHDIPMHAVATPRRLVRVSEPSR